MLHDTLGICLMATAHTEVQELRTEVETRDGQALQQAKAHCDKQVVATLVYLLVAVVEVHMLWVGAL